MVIPLLCVRPHPVQPGDGVSVALDISIQEHVRQSIKCIATLSIIACMSGCESYNVTTPLFSPAPDHSYPPAASVSSLLCGSR